MNDVLDLPAGTPSRSTTLSFAVPRELLARVAERFGAIMRPLSVMQAQGRVATQAMTIAECPDPNAELFEILAANAMAGADACHARDRARAAAKAAE